jgi:hypothetical protein
MIPTRSNEIPNCPQLHDLTVAELVAIQGGGVNDFPWDSLRELVRVITGAPAVNTQPSPRSPCIPA